MRRSARLDLSDIQGNILRGYGLPRVRHLFVRVDDPEAGRRWLAGQVSRVTTADIQARIRPVLALNLAFTAAGLHTLGAPAAVVSAFSLAFRQGMAARAGHLGDHGPSAPGRWVSGLGTGEAHVLVTVHARTKAILDDTTGGLEETLAPGLKVVHRRDAARLAQDREHFGFADGMGQPIVDGGPLPKQPPRPGSYAARRLPAGEFLFGHRDLDAGLPAAPCGPIGRNGTYMVYRELAQDVDGFERYLADQARQHHVSPDVVRAKLVGRWPNGVPLVLSPHGPGRAPEHLSDPGLDDFGYAADSDGFACPRGAHIRRVNPRDDQVFGVRFAERHRMIRRGMPWTLEPEADDGGAERGLVFICFVASIERQFEVVQGQWCNDGNVFGLGLERDALVGQGPGSGRMTLNGDPPRFLSPLPEVVTVQGGEYLVVPGLDGLSALASGRHRE